ncbi:MAG: hypothetical protein WBZ29_06570 [Methanocella sp.]
MFRSTVTRDQAVVAVRKWWQGRLKARDLPEQGLITECRMEHVPFWKLLAEATGRVDGFEYVSDEGTAKINMSRDIDLCFSWTGIACDSGDVGLLFLRNATGEYDAGRPSRAPGITISKDKAVLDGIEAIGNEVIKEKFTKIPNVTDKKISIKPIEVFCVYYPFWIVKYSYHRHSYSATVDGVTCDLRAGRAPGNIRLRFGAAAAGIAMCTCAVLFGIWTTLNLSVATGACLLIVTAIGSQALLREAFSFLVLGSRITCGDFNGGYRPFNISRRGRCKAARAAGWAGFSFLLLGLYYLFVARELWLSLIVMFIGLAVQLVPRAIISYRYDDCHDYRRPADNVRIS